MSKTLLVIGNKNYSSWSLRAWLALRKSGARFEERRVPLDTPRFREDIADLSPTRRVPVLWHDAVCIWDSLAIAEFANEQFAHGALWPAGQQQRAWARAISAEMHSGFDTLRARLPMNCRALGRVVDFEPALEADIGRILSIWCDCRQAHAEAGRWLFGDFSIADAMYAPVVLRFNSYSVEMSQISRDYVETVLGDSDVSDWVQAGRAEDEIIEADEVGADSQMSG